jgi:hypothetical protein
MDSTELREEIDRVLESGTLQHSAVLRRILGYLGEAAAHGTEDLKEYTIGVEALGKSGSYDPQRDSTVRAQVAKLRQKLDEYYRTDGAEHPVRISVPKGAFRLQLESQLESKPQRIAAIGRGPQSLRLLIPVLACLATALVAYRLGTWKAARATALPEREWTPELRLFWQPIIGNGLPVVVSYDVAMTVEVPPWKFRNPDINDPGELAASPAWEQLSNRLGHPSFRTEYPYVGFGIAQGTFLLSRLLTGQRPQPVLKRSTVLSWEDIAHSNVVFIGTGKTAKIRYILQQGDFQCDVSKITNLKPHPGDPSEFKAAIDARTGEYREQYGLISMLPGLDESTRMLVLGGGISEGDWAVVQYVTLRDRVADLVQHLKTTSGDVPKAFQVVVRIKYESRVPVSMEYVTHHVIAITGGLKRKSQDK